MELTEAKKQLEELIESYKERISKFCEKVLADVYLVDSKHFIKCDEGNGGYDSLCASVTLCASDATDEQGMCGFDLVVEVKKKKEVDDEEFKNALCEFTSFAEDFIKRLEEAPDKDEFIKAESEAEKAYSAEEMKKFEADMKKIKAANIAVICGVALLVVIAVFSFLFR